MIKGLILAGGEAKRLENLTKTIPKAFLQVADKPVIIRQIESFKKYGIDEVIVAVGHLSEYFEKKLKELQRVGPKITLSFENIPIGTGGAIRNAMKHIDYQAIVVNGDIVADFNFKQLINAHEKYDRTMTLCTTVGDFPGNEYGNVGTTRINGIHMFSEKTGDPRTHKRRINAGCYLMRRETIESIPENKMVSLEKEVIPELVKSGNIANYTHGGVWYDIGTLHRYVLANEYLLRRGIFDI